jgi:hypothetical protein
MTEKHTSWIYKKVFLVRILIKLIIILFSPKTSIFPLAK